MGQITAAIAHEVKQPILATATNAAAASRWLDAQPPNLAEARQALGRIVETAIEQAMSWTGAMPLSRRRRHRRIA